MPKIKLTCHGAGRSIGASCIELRMGGLRFLLDYGQEISYPVNLLPTKIWRPSKIDLVFGTHPHIDHMGGLPQLYQSGYDGKVICLNLGAKTWRYLAIDNYEIEKKRSGGKNLYHKKYIDYAESKMVESWEGNIGEVKYRLFKAGHIPGAVGVYLEYRGKSILYTGDFNGYETRLMQKCGLLPQKVNFLILDATYGNVNHPRRQDSEKKLKAIMDKTIKRGGSVLIASFAVGKAQEMQICIDSFDPPVPCFIDGLGCAITDLYLEPEYSGLLKQKDLQCANWRWKHVVNRREQRAILNRQAIILASSGSMSGGAIMNYAQEFMQNKKNTIILVGHMFKDSNSQLLFDKGYIEFGDRRLEAKCDVRHITYSSHSDQKMDKKLIDSVKSDMVIAQHGENQAVDAILGFAKKPGREVWGLRTGESREI